MRPAIVAVGGFESDTGKTTLVCELLRALKGWEAIKVSRGHYRSCGRDPSACCVSPLLGDEPVVRSGRAETFAPGKDTGRFWESGASNVHWVIVKDGQVEAGVRAAIGRVKSPGVLIEGNSFLRFIEPDFSVLVARADRLKIKPSARRVLSKASALYVSAEGEATDGTLFRDFEDWLKLCGLGETVSRLPVFTRRELPRLVESIEAACKASARFDSVKG